MRSQYLQWDIETIELKLKYAWKISRNTSLVKQNLIIFLNNQPVGEAAPNVRWGESSKKLITEYQSLRDLLPKTKSKLASFRSMIPKFDVSRSLKCALDMACSNQEVFTKKKYDTSYSLPILELEEYESFIFKNNLSRFNCLKIKLDTQSVKERIDIIQKNFDGELFVDFNEAFSDFEQFKPLINVLNKKEIKVVEQPFKEGNLIDNKKLKSCIDGALFLDEDITDTDLASNLSEFCDGVNIKIQKAGGPKRAQQIINQAKDSGLMTMVGCMVETSLGISASMKLENVDFYDLDGSLMIVDEPFKLCSENNGLLSF